MILRIILSIVALLFGVGIMVWSLSAMSSDEAVIPAMFLGLATGSLIYMVWDGYGPKR